MLRKICILLIFFQALQAQAAQPFSEFEQSFAEFSSAAADSLPFNAAFGQNWSYSQIDDLPRLGIGITSGVTIIPFAAIEPVVRLFNVSYPSGVRFLKEHGIILPCYSVDARMGLPNVPVDMGMKVGILPENKSRLLLKDITRSTILFGLDVNWRLIDSIKFLSNISLAGGVNYLTGSYEIHGLFSAAEDIIDVAGGHTLSIFNQNLVFNWKTIAFDLKVHFDKSISFFTVFSNLCISYGSSVAGGGLTGNVLFDGEDITLDDIEMVNAFYGEDTPDLTADGIFVNSKADGWAASIIGGVAFNLSFLIIDLNAMYNFTSRSYGGSFNLRAQF